jgi:RNA polymerase sigma factor (sigma-70 family)
MSHAAIRDYLRAVAGDPAGPADAELLARFAAARDESAFELLVWRHAALVQRVCRGVLRDHHAAEDAAQAAFLVLARKAHTFAGRGSVVGWLYRVARRVAGRLAKDHARRPANAADLAHVPAGTEPAGVCPDEAAALWAEVDRLPDHYRVPVLLCFFEGLTHAEAARRTGWPLGTVAGRLARAKDVLARRLSRKGVGLVAVALPLPAAGFVGGTAHAAVAFAGRMAVVPGVEPSVARLAEGAMTAMFPIQLKLAAAVAIACGLTAGVWALAPGPQVAPGFPQQPPAKPAAAAPVAAADRLADAAQRARSLNNLKQILLAMHSFHDVNGHFPGNITDKDGKPLLSWRVAILPYIEQEGLYKEFKLDEPWDSEHNKKLLAQMPDLYRVGFEPEDSTKTYYQVFAGPGSAFEPGQKVKILDVTDGTSNTIGVVEAGPPVEWTKPADLPFDADKPAKPELPFKNAFAVAMLDGAAYIFRPDIEADTLRDLIGRLDGVVTPDRKEFLAKLPLSKEELKAVQEMLRENEKLIDAVAGHLREQQKLLVELVRAGAAAEPRGIDAERLAEMNRGLQLSLALLKQETEELRKQVEAAKAKPPAVKK